MNTRPHKIWIAVLIASLLALAPASLIYAQTLIDIDGVFSDWAGFTAYVDEGGADDENAPADSDITELRAHAEVGGIYLLKAWDDTSFTPAGIAAGVSVRNSSGDYYRVYTVVTGNPASIPLSSLDINRCVDYTCSSQEDVCEGAACTGALAGSSTSWVDPFAGRPTPACDGTDCPTLDAAVELYIPWALIGGELADNQTVFLQFGSYPSGPAQAPKDSSGDNGITCRNMNGVYNCYVSDPTAVTLQSLAATPVASPSAWIAGALAAILLLSLLGQEKIKNWISA